MELYKIQDGDLIKPLPIPYRNGDYENSISVRCIVNDTHTIYDTHKYYGRLSRELRERVNDGHIIETPTTLHRNFICLNINNEIRFTNVGRTLNLMLTDNILDTNVNQHIRVAIDKNSLGYLTYDDSELVEIPGWEPLVESTNIDDWIDYIRKNQEGYLEDYLEKHGVLNNIQVMDKIYWPGCMYEIIQEDRDEKLGKLLRS